MWQTVAYLDIQQTWSNIHIHVALGFDFKSHTNFPFYKLVFGLHILREISGSIAAKYSTVLTT